MTLAAFYTFLDALVSNFNLIPNVIKNILTRVS